MCVKIFLLYYSVIAQFKLTLFSPFLAAVVAVSVSSTLLEGFFVCVGVGVCSLAAVKRSSMQTQQQGVVTQTRVRTH